MRLTADTTEADLTAPVTDARIRLSNAALIPTEPDGQVERLVDAVNDVWAQEALARARYRIVGCLSAHRDSTPEVLSRALLQTFVAILENGADDNWSGHKNDARRAAFEAVRKEISDLRYSLVPVAS